MLQGLILWLVVANLWGFLLMGLDKARTVKQSWRIPEMTFFLLAFSGGALGIEAGMVLFHHKTKKASFKWIVHLAFGLWIAVIFFIN